MDNTENHRALVLALQNVMRDSGKQKHKSLSIQHALRLSRIGCAVTMDADSGKVIIYSERQSNGQCKRRASV